MPLFIPRMELLMARRCSICASPQRLEIDALLVSNGTLRSIAGRFGTGKSALDRHRPHIAPAVAKAQEAAEVADAGRLLDKLVRLEKRAERLLEKAETAGQ